MLQSANAEKKKKRKTVAQKWKKKRRIKRLKQLYTNTMPEQTTYSKDDAPNVLAVVYPISTNWDEDEAAFMCELSAFDLQVHAASWQTAIDVGKAAQEWLISIYQIRNYTLPDF